jgi:phosphopantothenoylcysteine decarboxylase/phosphopantothenate--cysteine ligase
MRVLLGVSGGIAAYKAADLVSQLVKRRDDVRVVMTPNATRFVAPLTFEAMSAHPVVTDAAGRSLLSPEPGGDLPAYGPMEHIALAKWAELAVVAPATASTLGRLAVGLADDALGTIWMALPAGVPCLLCPAMNTAMWEHPAVQRNLRWLEELGRYTIVAPSAKRLACGDVGVGGLAEIPDILEAIEGLRPRAAAAR